MASQRQQSGIGNQYVSVNHPHPALPGFHQLRLAQPALEHRLQFEKSSHFGIEHSRPALSEASATSVDFTIRMKKTALAQMRMINKTSEKTA